MASQANKLALPREPKGKKPQTQVKVRVRARLKYLPRSGLLGMEITVDYFQTR